MKGDFQFVDVFGMDPDLLAMIPQPCCSMLLLFPMNDKVILNTALPIMLLSTRVGGDIQERRRRKN